MQARNKHKQQQWNAINRNLSSRFAHGDDMTIESIIYLIGVQELGKGVQQYSKEDKLALMNIAICKLLEPYGYYQLDYYDQDGWPHYKNLQKLPYLKPGEQTVLLKEAIIGYFEIHQPEFLKF